MGKNLRFLLAALLLPAATNLLYCQWTRATGPYGGYISSFALGPADPRGQTLFASSDYLGGVYRSTNGGTSWTNTGLGEAQVWSLATNGGSLFAAGSNGLYSTDDNGASWTTLRVGVAGFSRLAVVRQSVFAATFGHGMFRSTDSGRRWIRVSGGLPDSTIYCGSLCVIDTILIAGFSDGSIFRTSNYGASWQEIHAGSASSVNAIVNLNGVLFAGTFGSVDGGDGGILRLWQGDSSWSLVNAGLSDLHVSSLASQGQQLFAGTWQGGVYRSSNYGQSWVSAGLPYSNVRALFVNGTELFAGLDDGGGVYRTTNDGATWTAMNAGIDNPVIGAVAAGAGHLFVGTWHGEIFHSTDKGTSWAQLFTGMPGVPIAPITMDGLRMAACSDQVICSTDGGASWLETGLAPPRGTKNVLAIAGVRLVAALNETVFVSYFGSSTWFRSDMPGGTEIQGFATDGTRLYAAASAHGSPPDSGGAFLSANGGMHWVNIGLKNAYLTCVAAAGTNLYAGDNGAGVYHSSDEGKHWDTLNAGLTDTHTLDLVANEVGIFAVTWDGIYYRRTGDSVWTNASFPAQYPWLLALDDLNLWVGVRTAVWHRPIADIVTSVRSGAGAALQGYSLEPNYPNPFNPTTTIRYALPRRANVSLTVFNTLGQKVAELVKGDIDAGYHKLQFNAAGLSSGVYFYRLRAGSFQATKKLVITK